MGLLGKWVKYNEFFLFIPFFHELTYRLDRQTGRRIFTLDGSNDADLRKDVPFRGFVNIAPHFGGEITENPNFWGVNRRFQSKLANIASFMLSKLLDRFQPNFVQR